ncbi:MAG: hypothetical protein LUC25_05930 [Ruminococcus sp.]|nr:hypothetical protein [Ruminococcus sp.]
MLEIKVATDREEYFEKLSKLGLDEELTLVVESYDKGEVNGYGFYHLEGDSVSIDYIESYQDLILFDGIVRSILFKAMLSGIDKAVFSDAQLGKFQMLGFVQNNYKTIDSIGEFLSKCKSCGK